MLPPRCEIHDNCIASFRIILRPAKNAADYPHIPQPSTLDTCLLGHDMLADRLAEIGQTVLGIASRVILWNPHKRQWGKGYAEVR